MNKSIIATPPKEYKTSEKLLLLDLLLQCRRLNKVDFVKETGNPYSVITQRAHDLKNEGWGIHTEKRVLVDGHYFAYYSMREDFLDNYRKYGEEYAKQKERKSGGAIKQNKAGVA